MGVRVESAVYAGYTVPSFYDSLIAKLIVHASTCDEAIRRMERALNSFVIEGIDTTISLHRELLRRPDFCRGEISTRFLEESYEERVIEMV